MRLPVCKFTPRERQIVRLAVEGHSVKQIKDALSVGESTVRIDLKLACARAGAESLADLKRLVARGLVVEPHGALPPEVLRFFKYGEVLYGVETTVANTVPCSQRRVSDAAHGKRQNPIIFAALWAEIAKRAPDVYAAFQPHP